MKTLILVVDRDDDFGAKAGVVSPVISVDDCIKAASALGIADPEDSDTNALYAAINLYRDMEADPKIDELEVALICGNQKIGYRSDMAVVDQLNNVLDIVKPDRAVLVGDGAEDEYIYPIVSSRVKIDSIRKVYVKQAPGVEGTFYILKSTIEDPQKRRRFLAPVSWILMFIAMVYIFSNMISAGSITKFVTDSTTPLIVFVAGVLLSFYAYDMEDKISEVLETWNNRAKRGSIATVFTVMSIALIVLGCVVGTLSVGEVYTERDLQVVILFFVYSFWFFVFAFMSYAFGVILDSFIYSHTIKYRFVAAILNAVSIGLIVSGILDYMMGYSKLYSVDLLVYTIEVISGFALALVSAALRMRINSQYRSRLEASKVEAADEVH